MTYKKADTDHWPGSLYTRPVSICLLIAVFALSACRANHADTKASDSVSLLESQYACEEILAVNLTDARLISTNVVSLTDSERPWCKVDVIKRSKNGSDLTIWLGLPMHGWNGRLLGTGGGGYASGFDDFDNLARDGYIVAATDGGRTKKGWQGAADASFAINAAGNLDLQAIANYSHASIHEMTVTAKEVANVVFGQSPRFSYFEGCSNGGRQAMTEAQMYPSDYNGIVAGAPAVDIPRMHMGTLWPQLVMAQNNHVVDQCKLHAATESAVNSCDADDGLIDGLISDAGSCDFDASDLVGYETTQCGAFTVEDAAVVNSIWAGAKTQDGRFLWYGMRRGTDISGQVRVDDSQSFVNPSPILVDWVRFFLQQGNDWVVQDLTADKFERLYALSTEKFTSLIGPVGPDLSAFHERGGKIVAWHGEADQAFPADNSIGFLEEVRKVIGDDDVTSEFFRLFLAPGVGHCSGGNGPTAENALDSLIQWVENDKAPEFLFARTQDEDSPRQMTRPLCPYPQVARYIGEGDPDKAESFACVTN